MLDLIDTRGVVVVFWPRCVVHRGSLPQHAIWDLVTRGSSEQLGLEQSLSHLGETRARTAQNTPRALQPRGTVQKTETKAISAAIVFFLRSSVVNT